MNEPRALAVQFDSAIANPDPVEKASESARRDLVHVRVGFIDGDAADLAGIYLRHGGVELQSANARRQAVRECAIADRKSDTFRVVIGDPLSKTDVYEPVTLCNSPFLFRRKLGAAPAPASLAARGKARHACARPPILLSQQQRKPRTSVAFYRDDRFDPHDGAKARQIRSEGHDSWLFDSQAPGQSQDGLFVRRRHAVGVFPFNRLCLTRKANTAAPQERGSSNDRPSEPSHCAPRAGVASRVSRTAPVDIG